MKDGFDHFEYGEIPELPEIEPVETGLEGVTFWRIAETEALVDLELVPEEATEIEITFPQIGDREADGMLWSFCETHTMAAHHVFSTSMEQLTGEGIDQQKLFSEYMEVLSQHCVVITTDITSGSETAARTIGCLSENGCVIAAVSDSKWRLLMDLNSTGLWDSGIRILQFTGSGPEGIYINDPMNPSGRQMLLTVENMNELQGMLMEVYK